MRLFWILLTTAALMPASPIMPTAKVTLTSPGDPKDLIVHGIYISPYTLLINGQDYAAMCIDFRDESYVGDTWNAYLTPVAGGNFTDTYRATDVHVAKEYEEEAYLFSQITQPGITNSQRLAIQEAAWSITDPFFSQNRAAERWIEQAEDDYSSINLNGFEIVSSAGCDREQEFMIMTPEPAYAGMFGIALLLAAGIAGGVRKRMQRRALATVSM